MGCDIHLHVERKNSLGEWSYLDPKGIVDVPEWARNMDYYSWYPGRNYNAFAILANVRNGYGFAGIVTGSGFKPIAMPKGLPEDMSSRTAAEAEDWDADGHSHSYHTLADLEAFDWTQTTKLQGVVGAAEFCTHLLEGRPRSYSAGISGRTVAHISNEQMRQYLCTTQFGELMKAMPPEVLASVSPVREVECLGVTPPDEAFDPSLSYYTAVQWGETYSDAASYLYSTLMPLLRTLVDNPEDIRIVFWFDN